MIPNNPEHTPAHLPQFGEAEGQPNGSLNPSDIALGGIRGAISRLRDSFTVARIDRLDNQIAGLKEDRSVYMAAGQTELARVQVLQDSIQSGEISKTDLVNTPDPPGVEKALFSGAKHRMTRDQLIVLGEARHAEKIAKLDEMPKPRSKFQHRAGARANLRGDSIRKARKNQLGYTDIHGSYLEDPDDTKNVLKDERNTLSQRRETKKIGRTVRREKRKEASMLELLTKQATGKDTSGKIIKARVRRKERKAERLRARLRSRTGSTVY